MHIGAVFPHEIELVEPSDLSSLVMGLEAIGFDYGDAFRSVRRVTAGEDWAIADIAVPDGITAGLGIANEKRWGWVLGVAVSAVSLVFYLLAFSAALILTLVFAVAQLLLLVHPQSRQHQKIWFT